MYRVLPWIYMLRISNRMQSSEFFPAASEPAGFASSASASKEVSWQTVPAPSESSTTSLLSLVPVLSALPTQMITPVTSAPSSLSSWSAYSSGTSASTSAKTSSASTETSILTETETSTSPQASTLTETSTTQASTLTGTETSTSTQAPTLTETSTTTYVLGTIAVLEKIEVADKECPKDKHIKAFIVNSSHDGIIGLLCIKLKTVQNEKCEDDVTSSKRCTDDFALWKVENPSEANNKTLTGHCRLLKQGHVKMDTCVPVVVTPINKTEKIATDDKGNTLAFENAWTDWLICPEAYLAVSFLTDSNGVIQSMKCCLVVLSENNSCP